MTDINSAIIERLEKVVDTLQDNSVKMGQILAVHNEKLDRSDQVDSILFEKLDRISSDIDRETTAIKKGCERDIRLIDDRLRTLEKKMWSVAGALTVISFIVSGPGQSILRTLTNSSADATISPEVLGATNAGRDLRQQDELAVGEVQESQGRTV